MAPDRPARGLLRDRPVRTPADLAALLTVAALAVILFRLAQAAGRVHPLLGHLVKQVNHVLTGADLAWQAQVGPGLRLYHPTGVVLGPFVRIGAQCRVQQGVTVGGTGGDVRTPGDSPTLGDRVRLGAGAKVVGPVTLGDDVLVGANAVVVRSVPAGATAVGVPARYA